MRCCWGKPNLSGAKQLLPLQAHQIAEERAMIVMITTITGSKNIIQKPPICGQTHPVPEMHMTLIVASLFFVLPSSCFGSAEPELNRYLMGFKFAKVLKKGVHTKKSQESGIKTSAISTLSS